MVKRLAFSLLPSNWLSLNPKELGQTILEIRKALKSWPGWLSVGWQQFIYQHRRAVIGPFWQTINAAVWALGIGIIFKGALHGGDPSSMAYIASGIVIWNFIINCLVGGANVFNVNANFILNLRIPLLTHTMRLIVVALARILFQCVFLVPVLYIWGNGVNLNTLLVVPGILVLVMTSMLIVPIMGIIGARFRDFSFAVQAGVRFLFFASPVFWKPDILGTRGYLAHYNPVTHYLAIVREPLLGNSASLFSWSMVSVITLASAFLFFLLFHRTRNSIAYWL